MEPIEKPQGEPTQVGVPPSIESESSDRATRLDMMPFGAELGAKARPTKLGISPLEAGIDALFTTPAGAEPDEPPADLDLEQLARPTRLGMLPLVDPEPVVEPSYSAHVARHDAADRVGGGARHRARGRTGAFGDPDLARRRPDRQGRGRARARLVGPLGRPRVTETQPSPIVEASARERRHRAACHPACRRRDGAPHQGAELAATPSHARRAATDRARAGPQREPTGDPGRGTVVRQQQVVLRAHPDAARRARDADAAQAARRYSSSKASVSRKDRLRATGRSRDSPADGPGRPSLRDRHRRARRRRGRSARARRPPSRAATSSSRFRRRSCSRRSKTSPRRSVRRSRSIRRCWSHRLRANHRRWRVRRRPSRSRMRCHRRCPARYRRRCLAQRSRPARSRPGRCRWFISRRPCPARSRRRCSHSRCPACRQAAPRNRCTKSRRCLRGSSRRRPASFTMPLRLRPRARTGGAA